MDYRSKYIKYKNKYVNAKYAKYKLHGGELNNLCSNENDPISIEQTNEINQQDLLLLITQTNDNKEHILCLSLEEFRKYLLTERAHFYINNNAQNLPELYKDLYNEYLDGEDVRKYILDTNTGPILLKRINNGKFNNVSEIYYKLEPVDKNKYLPLKLKSNEQKQSNEQKIEQPNVQKKDKSKFFRKVYLEDEDAIFDKLFNNYVDDGKNDLFNLTLQGYIHDKLPINAQNIRSIKKIDPLDNKKQYIIILH